MQNPRKLMENRSTLENLFIIFYTSIQYIDLCNILIVI